MFTGFDTIMTGRDKRRTLTRHVKSHIPKSDLVSFGEYEEIKQIPLHLFESVNKCFFSVSFLPFLLKEREKVRGKGRERIFK